MGNNSSMPCKHTHTQYSILKGAFCVLSGLLLGLNAAVILESQVGKAVLR